MPRQGCMFCVRGRVTSCKEKSTLSTCEHTIRQSPLLKAFKNHCNDQKQLCSSHDSSCYLHLHVAKLRKGRYPNPNPIHNTVSTWLLLPSHQHGHLSLGVSLLFTPSPPSSDPQPEHRHFTSNQPDSSSPWVSIRIMFRNSRTML